MREKHCALAVLDHFGRCIAICHYNIGPDSEDCIGKKREPIPHEFEDDVQKRRI